MITGMHAIVFSPQAEKVRAFFADVIGLPDGEEFPIYQPRHPSPPAPGRAG
jgi:hypothetical protein